jgi:GntP family gluconate:H+ symporter
LIDVGLAPALLRLLDGQVTSPIVLGWLMAAAVRLATGSATVATVTAAGLMAAMPVAPAVRPEWIVLAIGAGSIFFSYVNDPGFWLVKGFLGTSTGGTTASWSVLETLMSVTGLFAILVSSRIFS